MLTMSSKKDQDARTSRPKPSRDLAPRPRKKHVASDHVQSPRATKKIAVDDPSSGGVDRPRHRDNAQPSRITEDERRRSKSPMKPKSSDPHTNLERVEEGGKHNVDGSNTTPAVPDKTLESTSSPEANTKLPELPKMRRLAGPKLQDDHDSASAIPEETSGGSNSHQTSAKANQRTLDAERSDSESSCSEDFEGPEMGNRSKMPTGGPYLPWPEDFDTSRLLELAKFPRPMADDWE